MHPRTNTPDRQALTEDGRQVTTIRVKRACNGCGRLLGDADDRDVDDNGNLTDVRAECPTCAAIVALQAAGCRAWNLSLRNIGTVDNATDRDGVFAKGYWEWDASSRKTVCVGLRIGQGPDRQVARFGDWLVRHPDGKWTIHPAPQTD
ncbi:hypothetical protein [Actinacidiphila glaucinigra]|uniref:hypothetical protein n=1 Tax=Actinacidiphila glaucinigra TaxID=235986 RepID=UPI0035DFE144